jgi:predicted PurR-regulated permease PerM
MLSFIYKQFQALKTLWNIKGNQIAEKLASIHQSPDPVIVQTTTLDTVEVADTAHNKNQNDQIITTQERSFRKMFFFWSAGLIVVIIGWTAFTLSSYLLMIIIAFIIAVAVESIIAFLQKHVARWRSIALAYILLIGFLLSGVLVMIPFMAQQITEIGSIIVEQARSVQSEINNQWIDTYIQTIALPDMFKNPLIEFVNQDNIAPVVQDLIVSNASQIATLWSNYLGNAGIRAVQFVANFIAIFANLIIVFVVAVFFSLEKELVLQTLIRITGNNQQIKTKISRLYVQLGNRLQWQLLLSLYIFIISWLWLIIVGRFGINLEHKFTIALLAGLFEFLPYIGPALAWIAAVVVAILSYGRWWALIIAILFWIIQRTENNILIPAIMSKTLGISPTLIILCALASVSLMGILWVLLALPMAIMISIIMEE